MFGLDSIAAENVLTRYVGSTARAFLARPFPRKSNRRLVFYYELKAISFTQANPFIYYADQMRARYGVDVRCIPNSELLKGHVPRHDSADIVLLQTWFDLDSDALGRVIGLVREANPSAQISFVDSFAHSDIRQAQALEPEISFYIKKSRLRQESDIFRAFRGDTNLTEFYGDLYGISAEPVDWQVPRNILPKLRLSPNFFTAPRFLKAFARSDMPAWGGRPLDIQTRFGINGSPWYKAMRQDALDKVRGIKGLKLSPADRVSYRDYMIEMRQSKICFSPHGYGELCWRDIEGILSGAVLVKPNMDHLESLPDLYRSDETYLPVRWDFEDLEPVIHRLLHDEDLCRYLSENAFRAVQDYVQNARFVDDMAFLFDN
ncbi:MAG: glycosyltransferase family 1 protein [Pseudomonadota bacterium]